jgi:CheY-like chemotaxis protein
MDMTPDMAFECLLVTRDPEVVGVMGQVLRGLSVDTNICLHASRAADLLAEGSTDLIVIDVEGDKGSLEFLNKLPNSVGWRKLTIVALSADDRPIPNAYLVAQKPLTVESAAKILKGAYSKMLQEHRRHTRYALMTSLVATDKSGRTMQIIVTDIGYGGLGLSTRETLAVGDLLACHLLLPGAKRAIDIEVRVLWTRRHGVVGGEFVHISPRDFRILLDWLEHKDLIKRPRIARP